MTDTEAATSQEPDPAQVPTPRRRFKLSDALVGIVGVVIGGIIASASAYYTAKVQVDSQAKEARAEYIRQQSQTVYTKMIADSTDILFGADKCIDIRTVLNQSAAEKKQFLAQQVAQVKLMQGDSATIQIVGSDAAANDASQLQAEISIIQASCTLQDDPKFAAELKKATHQAIVDRQNLISGARTDLIDN